MLFKSFPALIASVNAASWLFPAIYFSALPLNLPISASVLRISLTPANPEITNKLQTNPAITLRRNLSFCFLSLSRNSTPFSINHRCGLLTSPPRCCNQSSATAKVAPRNKAPSSLPLSTHCCNATISPCCQMRNLRFSCIHPRNRPQWRIKASCTTSTVSSFLNSSQFVTTNRLSANRVTKSQLSPPTSSLVANLRVSSVPSPGCTN